MKLPIEKIYSTGEIPEQWKVSKIVPIFKKGSKTQIENYRPMLTFVVHPKSSRIIYHESGKSPLRSCHSWEDP